MNKKIFIAKENSKESMAKRGYVKIKSGMKNTLKKPERNL